MYARVIPIYKSEDKRKCGNYRPISILPIMSKIFEGEVFTQIYSFLNKHALLSKFQSGFRPKHGILGALIQVCDQWLQDMDEGKINGVVFLDICKAIDSVNHEILLEKLKTQLGMHYIELKWFQSYLRNRKQVCSVNDQTSSARTIICGIPQVMFIGSTHNLNNKIGNRPVNKIPVPQTNTFQCLGVNLDEKLSWEKHIDSVCHKISAGIGAIKRIKSYVPHKTLHDVYKTLIQPDFDYCSPL